MDRAYSDCINNSKAHSSIISRNVKEKDAPCILSVSSTRANSLLLIRLMNVGVSRL